MSTWSQSFKPILVLTVVCLIAGIVLSSANVLTAPVIVAYEEAANNETYFTALPEADSFTSVPCELAGVTAVLRADNGAGWVITAQARGYGGQVPAAVAFSPEGEILRVIMMPNGETPGLGQKVTEPDFAGQFSGMAAQSLSLEDIDAVSGATISSRAAAAAINLAIEAFQSVTGGAA
ncbi:MAG: FMN-binding protein [Oscillospiraceae bacterium]|nr:FMN-binding protein [Oscillospiraceae bacterium]